MRTARNDQPVSRLLFGFFVETAHNPFTIKYLQITPFFANIYGEAYPLTD